MFGLPSPELLLHAPKGPVPVDARRRRKAVQPPSLRCAPASSWQRLKFWLLAPAPLEAAPPLSELPRVRGDFLACLGDLSGDEVHELHRRIDHARSLRELWHLRTTMFGLLARLHSQAEAERRLAELNRHFADRRPGSGLVGLLT